MMWNHRLPIFSLLLITSIFIETSPKTHTQQDIPVVANGFRGTIPNPPALIERARFGMEGSEDALLIKPAHLLFTPDGSKVIVTDIGSKSLHVFDREGNFIYRIGRSGAGPGELLMPVAAYFTSSDLIAVPDLMNMRTNFYNLDGTFVSSNPMDVNALRAEIPLPLGHGKYLRRAGQTMLNVDAARGDPGDDTETAVFEIVNELNEVIRTIGERKKGENLLITDHLNRHSVAVSGNKIAVAYRVSSDIRIYDAISGRIERIITRRTAFRVREPIISNKEMNTGVILDLVSLSASYDQQGRLWVLTRLVNNEEFNQKTIQGNLSNLVRLEVYDEMGVLLTDIPLEIPANLIYFSPNGDLWLLDYMFNAQVRRLEVYWP